MSSFCGLNDRTDRPDTMRNSWTYKRFIFDRTHGSSHRIWKQRNSRSHRTTIRGYVSHSDFDKVKEYRHTRSSGGGRNSGRSELPCYNSKDLPYTYQDEVCQSRVIASYKHGQRRMPLKEVLVTPTSEKLVTQNTPERIKHNTESAFDLALDGIFDMYKESYLS